MSRGFDLVTHAKFRLWLGTIKLKLAVTVWLCGLALLCFLVQLSSMGILIPAVKVLIFVVAFLLIMAFVGYFFFVCTMADKCSYAVKEDPDYYVNKYCKDLKRSCDE